MFVQEISHIANGALLESGCPCNDWAEERLCLSCSAYSGVNFEPVGVFWVSQSFKCKLLTQFLSSDIKYKVSQPLYMQQSMTHSHYQI